MARDYVWIDDRGQLRRSTEVIEVSDVTVEILDVARSIEGRWFAEYIWIDWPSFFADLQGSVIPSTGRELDLGDACGTPAMTTIRRHIQKRRMIGISRWRLAAGRGTEPDDAPTHPAHLHLVVDPPDGSARPG